MTPEIFQVLQDVRHLSHPGRKEIDGSKAIYFFEYGVSKQHIQRVCCPFYACRSHSLLAGRLLEIDGPVPPSCKGRSLEQIF